MNPYITPDEAVELSTQVTVKDLNMAHDIYEKCMQKKGNEELQFGEHWAVYSAMAVIYNAGRVSGIRTERARRKKVKT